MMECKISWCNIISADHQFSHSHTSHCIQNGIHTAQGTVTYQSCSHCGWKLFWRISLLYFIHICP